MIDIGINCLKNFETQYDRLQKEHGTYIARINGFDDDQLSYTDFIRNFIDEDVVADSSIDSNSNVSRKDIVTLLTEMPKPHRKLIAFNKIYYEYEKMFGFKNANEWLDMEWVGKLYMHDGDTSTFKSYCFTGDTEILTNYGVKPLVECLGYPIKVLNKNHGWEDAEVQYFGRQPIMQLTLERFGVIKNIKVTPNHRWFVRGYNKGVKTTFIKQTYELTPGMKIPFNTSHVWSQVEPSPFGVAHGFFTGDGRKGDIRVANFCGDKISLLPYFTPANVTGSEKEFNTRGIPEYFNRLPSISESPSYLYGWLSGYFAADGCVDTKGRCTIASTQYENLQKCRDILCVLGMPVNEIRYQDRVSNLTGEMGRVYVLTLSDEYLKDDFFIRPQHRERFLANKNKSRKDRAWTVTSVVNLGIEEDVFCAVVPGTQSFTLDNNILTHNCFAYTLKDLAERGLYFIGSNQRPPRHLGTFVTFVKEFINYNSNRTSGAVGLPDLLIYMFYFWKKDLENHYMGITEEYALDYAKQNFQTFIFACNQPYTRDGQQSAFTNTSIFDRPYFEALFGGVEYPDGTFVIDYEDEIMEFQKWYMEVMGEIRKDNMFTFPVNSMSLLRKEGEYDLDTLDAFEDPEFAEWAILHNMIWSDSNLFCDTSVNSLSNCCRLKSDIRDLGYVKMPYDSFAA